MTMTCKDIKIIVLVLRIINNDDNLLDAFASKVRDTCFETLVLMATSAAHERVQLTCTKGALMVVIKNRFLIPQLNEQVTEPLIETVNTLSSLILPIIMTRAILQASKHEPRTKKIKFNINDAMNANLIEDSEDILEPSATTTDILGEEETDDGEMDRLLRNPDYIDVSEQGTISNASRLDRVLKDRERTKYKKSKKSNIELIDALTHDDIAYLFDFNISSTERESLLSKFEVPVLARNQITGALTALNILLENDQVIGNIITGESFKAPILDVLDDIVIDIDDIDSKIYNRRGTKNKHSESSTGTKSSIIASILSSEAADSRLPESIQKLLKSLVHLTLYPALEEWANSHYYDYPLDTLTESRATEIYTNVIDWICTFAEPPKYKRENIHSPDSSEDEDRSTGSSDDFGLAKYRHGKDMPSFKSTTSHMKGYGVRSLHRSNYRGHHSDSSSDSENDDSSSDDGALISVYPKRSKKIESAAERMGETRRKGENFDLDDMLSVSYASEYYLGFSNRALVLLSSLSRYASVRQYLIQDIRFIPVLVYLFEDYNNLTDNVMACLGSLFAKDPFVAIPETSFQVVAILLWRGIRMSSLNRKQSYLFYSRLVLSYCSRFVAPDVKNSAVVNNPSFTEIDLVSRSKYCIINHESFLQVRNDTWTFESVRANRCVPANLDREDNEDEEEGTSRKYAFEVKLESDGLMQIGWVNDQFEFDAEGGNGVGDDTNSYGYDGCRVKKWHGKYSSMRTSYGLKWAEGDIITCTIDMDLGEISYYKNGQDMGVAFYGISISCVWYPAISLSTGQQCKFQFGSAIDPLRYLPEGCTPVGVLSNKKPIELPPLRITRPANANSDENDITDLANALEKMSVHSPVYPSDNDDSIGPSLKSVNETLSIKSSSKHTPEPRNQKSPEYAFSVTIPNSQKQNILPSLYFEVAIEFLHKDDDLYLFESVITFGLKSLSPGGSLHFAYDRYKKTCSLFIGSNRSEPISLEICDGDKLGILYIDETNTIGLTYNGVVKGLIYLDKNIKTIPYLPFVTGYMRNEINYGEEPLAWKSADSVSSKQHISNYLDKILGDRTTLKRF
ncbi:SPRY domain-containing protein [Thamnidium elegans]|nr:SPRY domain-containing protein [Thamnidium elegans]